GGARPGDAELDRRLAGGVGGSKATWTGAALRVTRAPLASSRVPGSPGSLAYRQGQSGPPRGAPDTPGRRLVVRGARLRGGDVLPRRPAVRLGLLHPRLAAERAGELAALPPRRLARDL